MLPNLKWFVDFKKKFKLPILPLLTSIISKLSQPSNLLSFFRPSTKTNHSFPTKEGCNNKYSQDSNQRLFSKKKKTQNYPNLPFKEKEKEGGAGRSQLDS